MLDNFVSAERQDSSFTLMPRFVGWGGGIFVFGDLHLKDSLKLPEPCLVQVPHPGSRLDWQRPPDG